MALSNPTCSSIGTLPIGFIQVTSTTYIWRLGGHVLCDIVSVTTISSKRTAAIVVMEIGTQHFGVGDEGGTGAVFVLTMSLLSFLGWRWI